MDGQVGVVLVQGSAERMGMIPTGGAHLSVEEREGRIPFWG
jgi:hypothetical protein